MDLGHLTTIRNQHLRPPRKVKSAKTGRTRVVKDAETFEQVWVQNQQGENIRLCLTSTMIKSAIYLAKKNPEEHE
jgi:hypothetical protein